MLKRILLCVILAPMAALAQTYPSPTFNNVTSQGTATLNNATVSGTFTATGKIGLPSLAAQAANTVVGNATGSSATPTAITVSGCNGAAQALQWTNGSGFGCNSSVATSGANANITSLTGLTTPLSVSQGGTGVTSSTGSTSVVLSASPALTGTPTAPTAATNTNTTQIATTAFVEGEFANPPAAGFGSTTRRPVLATTISATGSITPSTTNGIVGTTTNDNANAGSIGEVISSSVASPGVSLTTATPSNVTSISLTAGDWDVWGNVYPAPAGTTVIQQERATITTTSASIGNYGDAGSFLQQITLASGAANSMNVGPIRLSLASTTTVYLVTQETFSTSTCTAFGQIFARRRR